MHVLQQGLGSYSLLQRSDLIQYMSKTNNVLIIQADPSWYSPNNIHAFAKFEIDLHSLALLNSVNVYRFIPYASTLLIPQPNRDYFESILNKITLGSINSARIQNFLMTYKQSDFNFKDNRDYISNKNEHLDKFDSMIKKSSLVDSSEFSSLSPNAFDPYLKVAFDGQQTII